MDFDKTRKARIKVAEKNLPVGSKILAFQGTALLKRGEKLVDKFIVFYSIQGYLRRTLLTRTFDF